MTNPIDPDRLAKQAREISVLLSDAGIGPCTIVEGVRQLINRMCAPLVTQVVVTCFCGREMLPAIEADNEILYICPAEDSGECKGAGQVNISWKMSR